MTYPKDDKYLENQEIERVTIRTKGRDVEGMAEMFCYKNKTDFLLAAIDAFTKEEELKKLAEERGFVRQNIYFANHDIEGILSLAKQEGKTPYQIVLDAVEDYIPRHQQMAKDLMEKLTPTRQEIYRKMLPKIMEGIVAKIDDFDKDKLIREISWHEPILPKNKN